MKSKRSFSHKSYNQNNKNFIQYIRIDNKSKQITKEIQLLPSVISKIYQSKSFKLPNISHLSFHNKTPNKNNILKTSQNNQHLYYYSNNSKKNAQNQEAHLPKRHLNAISSYNLVDYSLNTVKIKPEAPYHDQNLTYKASILCKNFSNYNQASKVDFFNQNNERRLKLSRNKSIQQISGQKGKIKKQDIQVHRKSKHFMSAKLHCLLKDYLVKKQTKDAQQFNYLVVGKNKDEEPQQQQIQQNQNGQQFRRRFHKWH